VCSREQRYRCQHSACTRTIFQLAYVAFGRQPETQRQMVEMTLNSSGIRDKAHVLRISPLTGLKVLKKESALPSVNKAALDTLTSAATEVLGAWGEAAEVDEMWSFVGKKQAPRWLWHALDHHTGKGLCCRNSRGDGLAVFLRCETQEGQDPISSPQLARV